MIQRIVITPGEPAGIGADICIQLAQQPPGNVQLVVVADPLLLQQRADQLALPLGINEFNPEATSHATQPGHLTVEPISLRTNCHAGVLDTANVPYVLDTLARAVELCQQKICSAVVTGPVHKGVINDAGVKFSGHTEFLAELCAQQLTVMMLATEGLRVALVTTHLPLIEVAKAISRQRLEQVITILDQDYLGSIIFH